MAWAQHAAVEAGVVEGEAKDAEEDEEDVLARDGAVWARTCRGGGEGDDVDVAGGAEDIEVGVRAVEEGEVVAQCADEAVGDGLDRVVGGGGGGV